jgi:hypothetical protein
MVTTNHLSPITSLPLLLLVLFAFSDIPGPIPIGFNMSRRFCCALVATVLGIFLASCNNASPEKYFDEAVLNVNLITPFGGQAALYSLAILRLN